MPARIRQTDDGEDWSLEELAGRARWGGLLPGVPPLTDEQRAIWIARREASDDWHPQHALTFLWKHVDPNHGGPWAWAGFAAALAADDREIERVTAAHPEQAVRLAQWRDSVQALAWARDGNHERRIGFYYERLAQLGHEA